MREPFNKVYVHGRDARTGYIDHNRDHLEGFSSLMQALSEGVLGVPTQYMSLCGD